MRLKILLLSLLLARFSLAQHILVLGIAQDGGFPHIGCKDECQMAYENPEMARYITSLALVDPESKKWWLFEATPDMDDQLQYFQEITDGTYSYLPEGIFLTHAHIGHYTGLMTLGREALGSNQVKVYALPKMLEFLKNNGPWSQLVELKNIDPVTLSTEINLKLDEDLSIDAFEVPHRDEFSETAGFRININSASYLFIPDIDKWSKWNQSIVELVQSPRIKFAFLDATFFADGELPNRAMSEVPHPFVTETMELFEKQELSIKQKIVFIHLNHTNPLLFDEKSRIKVLKEGYQIAEQGKMYK